MTEQINEEIRQCGRYVLNQAISNVDEKEQIFSSKMNDLIDNWQYLLKYTIATLRKCGLIKQQKDFSRAIRTSYWLNDNLSKKRLKPKITDVSSIINIINSIIDELNNITNSTEKQTIINILNTLNQRYYNLFVDCQRLYNYI